MGTVQRLCTFSSVVKSKRHGSTAQSITEQVYYDAKTMHKLYQKFAEGLAKHPDRLDLWFGKIHVQLLENHSKEAVETMKQVIDRSVINHQR